MARVTKRQASKSGFRLTVIGFLLGFWHSGNGKIDTIKGVHNQHYKLLMVEFLLTNHIMRWMKNDATSESEVKQYV